MPDLSTIGCNTLELQQRHERFQPRIGDIYSTHVRPPGLRCVQACGWASSGAWLVCGSTIGAAPLPSPAATRLDAMNWPSRAAAGGAGVAAFKITLSPVPPSR